MTRMFFSPPAAYVGDIIRFLYDDMFLGLYYAVHRIVPNAAAASAAAVAGVLLAAWLFFRAVFFALSWLKGETRV